MTTTATNGLGWTVKELGPEPVIQEPIQQVQLQSPASTEPVAAAKPAQPGQEPVLKTEPVKPDAFNPKEIFGEDYDSVDKVKEVLGKAKDYEVRLSEYEKKVKDSEVSDPYLKSIISWHQQGKDRSLHDLVYFSDPSKMEPQEKIALKLQIESGLTRDEAMAYVSHNYKLGEDFDDEDPSVSAARVAMKIDAGSADRFISEWREKESQPAPTFDYAAQVQTWTPHIESTVQGLKSFEVLDGIAFQADDKMIADVSNHIKTVLGTEGVEMDINDPKQQEALKAMAKDHFVAKNFDKILTWYRNEWEKKATLKESNARPEAGRPLGESTAPKTGNSWMQNVPTGAFSY
jgi:hypothetical protein